MSSCTNVTGGSLDGGRYIELDNDLLGGCQWERKCTSGFPMRFAGTYGVSTAGHCFDGNGTNYPADSSGFVLNHTSRDADLFYVHQPTQRYASVNAYWQDGPGTADDDDAGYLRRNDASVSYPGRIWSGTRASGAQHHRLRAYVGTGRHDSLQCRVSCSCQRGVDLLRHGDGQHHRGVGRR